MRPYREHESPYYMPGGMRESLGRMATRTSPAVKVETAAEPTVSVLYGPRGEVLRTFGGPRPIGFRRDR